jgi:hypothetical protein
MFEPFTDWMPAIGLDAAKMVIKRKSVAVTGTAPTFNVKPAIQVAVVRPDNPDDWAAISGQSAYTGAGESNTGVMTISGTTGGKMFVRFGVSYYLGGTAPTSGQADVEVVLSYKQCGEIVGSMTQDLQAFNTTTNSFVAVTGWVPAIDADKVVAAFVITALVNNFRCQLAYRTASTSTQSPSAWALLEGASYRTTDGETSTGEISLSITSEMYVQFGVAFSQSSAGAAPGQAAVSTAVAVRRT